MTKLGITSKLTLVFILFAGAVLVGLGIPAYINGRATLESATISELLTTAIEKKAALATWVADRQQNIGDIADQAHLRETISALITAEPGSSEAGRAHADLVNELETWAGEGRGFLSIEVIDASTGGVIAAADVNEEGKFREEQPYFINGLRAAYVQNPYYDISWQRPGMTAAAPVLSPDGEVIAVLAGTLNMDEMEAIIQRRSGLHQTDDVYLVNSSNLFVTQPRLNPDPAVLKRGVHTEAVNRCLAHNSGAISAPDYRNVPAFIVYRWLPDRQLCLITKIDRYEALAPSRALALTMALTGGLILLLGSIVAFALSRTIARPVRQLSQGAEQISLGNLEHRIEVISGDEIGRLGTAFNKMATAIGEKETQLRKWAADLEQRVEERTTELRASEERYRILSETSPDMIFVIDRKDKVQYVNKMAAGQFGKTPEQVIGKERTELFPPGMAENQALGLQQVLKSGASLSSESSIAFPGGQLWLDTQLVPLRNEAGEVSAVMGVSRDITERKRAEEALRETNQYLDNLLDYANAPIIVWDPQFRITRFNHAFETLTGRSAEEVLGKPLNILFPPVQMEASMELIHKTLTGERWEGVEIRILHVGGSIRTVLWNSATLFSADGKIPVATIAQGQDITERKLAEDDLRIKNQVFEDAIVAQSITNSAAVVTHSNPVFMRMWGYATREQALGMRVDTFLANPAEVAPILEALAAHGIWEGEFLAKRVDGKTFMTRGFISSLLDARGQLVGYQSTNLDVTKEKEAEALIKKMVLDLERSNAELERFAYVASHDLQEPLRMVTSYLQLLERRYKDKLDGDALEFINFAVDGSNRMKMLIGDLLSYSRVGTSSEEFTLTDCEEVLARVLTNLQISIEENKAKVTHDPLPGVMADETQLGSLFQNLIGNAIKFHGKKPPRIHVGVNKKDEKNWVFSISDNGIGIDPQYFERIFIIFQRLHNREDYPGTGIGLAISKRIIERHGGRIWIESHPETGSTFFFTLPIIGESK
jgi:PAS domain S-box-containing protein